MSISSYKHHHFMLRTLVMLGLFFSPLFLFAQDSLQVTEIKTFEENTQWTTASDLIMDGSKAVRKKGLWNSMPHNWGTRYAMDVMKIEKGDMPDKMIFIDIGCCNNDKLDSALMQNKLLKFYFIKTKKATTSGFTDLNGLFWKLVAWEARGNQFRVRIRQTITKSNSHFLLTAKFSSNGR